MNLACDLELFAGRKLDGRLVFQGLQISIENSAGSTRKGFKPDGTQWKTLMKFPYGYIRMTEGVDGDHVDCFVGPNERAKFAYVIHSLKAPKFKKFDEDKVMLGFDSPQEAKRVFLSHYDDKRFFGGLEIIPMDKFKKKVLATKDDPVKLRANQTELAKVHMDVNQTFHPPSLKNPDRVPADQPGETNNRFGDVDKRKSRQTAIMRHRLSVQNAKLSRMGGLTTLVQNVTGKGNGK